MQNFIRSKSVSRCLADGFGLVVLALVAMPPSKLEAAPNDVIIEPELPSSDQFISISAHGWFPETCWEINGSLFSQSGDTIYYHLNGAPNWLAGCYFMIISYYYTDYHDPLPAGAYTLIVYDGTGHSMDTTFYVSSSQCCEGVRGNIDSDPEDQTTISDLVYLVDYMFTNGPPPWCATEVDLNTDDQYDIADLVYMVDYMFNGGPPPAACP